MPLDLLLVFSWESNWEILSLVWLCRPLIPETDAEESGVRGSLQRHSKFGDSQNDTELCFKQESKQWTRKKTQEKKPTDYIYISMYIADIFLLIKWDSHNCEYPKCFLFFPFSSGLFCNSVVPLLLFHYLLNWYLLFWGQTVSKECKPVHTGLHDKYL